MSSRNVLLHPVIGTAVAINAGILLLSYFRGLGGVAPLWSLLGEDRMVEWMQFLCFTAIAVMLAFVAAERWARKPGVSLALLGIAGVSVVVALAALEEISWFQRVLGVQSPEFFVQNNRQAETNLHNLALGNSGSIHKTVLLKLIFLVGITHNLILPLVARSRPGVKRLVESLGLYLPPLSASIAYLVLVALSHLLIEHPRKGELGEMFGAVHYLSTVFMAYFVGYGYAGPAVIDNPGDRKRVAILFALGMLFLLMVSALLGATSPTPVG